MRYGLSFVHTKCGSSDDSFDLFEEFVAFAFIRRSLNASVRWPDMWYYPNQLEKASLGVTSQVCEGGYSADVD
jgi:hypothetical protein